ncbi:MAG: hypothetical protein JSS36_10305 [Proteobacteria bacterium]|nr:hypothetical protein [Pseudomonadota bacterium]
MDSFRGSFADHATSGYAPDDDLYDDEIEVEPPPPPVGQDERRMQVRAYNHWASLLGERNFPAISDFHAAEVPDFAPNSVLLDFSCGIENPAIAFLGDKLAAECDAKDPIRRLADVPGRSLLSRITDHYMQILANQAPIGFEAEFVNQREATILYRGILLPFSTDGQTISHILGVINWKELADQATTDELLLQIDQALAEVEAAAPPAPAAEAEVPAGPPPSPAALAPRAPGRNKTMVPLDHWADGPLDEAPVPIELDPAPLDILDLDQFGEVTEPLTLFPAPTFAQVDPLPAVPAVAGPLREVLAAARALALAASSAEDRSRAALYAAISRAWDVALAAADAPREFGAVLAEAGIALQDRAPFTPIVKLVFGASHDKTRLAEYAAALGAAQRLALPAGALADHLARAPGGLKAVIAEERKARRAEEGRVALPPRREPRATLARKLRRLPERPLGDFATGAGEFTLLVARRLPDGRIAVLGEAGDDLTLVEKAAKKIIG